MTTHRLTKEQFLAASNKTRVYDQGKEVAFKVLVEGVPESEVVEMFGVKRQWVARVVQTVLKKHLESPAEAADCTVEITVPTPLAHELQQLQLSFERCTDSAAKSNALTTMLRAIKTAQTKMASE